MKVNILNKEGMLTEEDRKSAFTHPCNYVTFYTCLDLSEPVRIAPLGISKEVSVENYSRDLASFITYWKRFVMKDLNGFSGFGSVDFELDGVKLV